VASRVDIGQRELHVFLGLENVGAAWNVVSVGIAITSLISLVVSDLEGNIAPNIILGAINIKERSLNVIGQVLDSVEGTLEDRGEGVVLDKQPAEGLSINLVLNEHVTVVY
jgi:hypothetical protein